MAYFDWTRELGLGIAAMDDGHRQLVDRMNRIHELDRQQAQKTAIAAAFADLGSCIERHFADEEAYMLQIGFPDQRRHAAIHADLLRRFAEHRANFERGDGRVPPSVFRFLVSWLASHIKGIDRMYAEHPTPVRQ